MSAPARTGELELRNRRMLKVLAGVIGLLVVMTVVYVIYYGL